MGVAARPPAGRTTANRRSFFSPPPKLALASRGNRARVVHYARAGSCELGPFFTALATRLAARERAATPAARPTSSPTAGGTPRAVSSPTAKRAARPTSEPTAGLASSSTARPDMAADDRGRRQLANLDLGVEHPDREHLAAGQLMFDPLFARSQLGGAPSVATLKRLFALATHTPELVILSGPHTLPTRTGSGE